jgi:hypothetical protein
VEFQIKDQTYFLTLAEHERRWCFAVATPHGTRTIPVYVDAGDPALLVVLQGEMGKVLN